MEMKTCLIVTRTERPKWQTVLIITFWIVLIMKVIVVLSLLGRRAYVQANTPEYNITTYDSYQERTTDPPEAKVDYLPRFQLSDEDRIKTSDFLYKLQNPKSGEDPLEAFKNPVKSQRESSEQEPQKSTDATEVENRRMAIKALEFVHKLQISKADQYSSDPVETKDNGKKHLLNQLKIHLMTMQPVQSLLGCINFGQSQSSNKIYTHQMISLGSV